MRFLVTGSSGFIGYHLTKQLLKNGNTVYGLDNHNDYYDVKLKEHRRELLKNKNFHFYESNLDNINIPKKSIDVAINLAAQAGVRVEKEKEYLYEKTNIEGFKLFCKFCKNNNIKKIIYASSSSVYSDESNLKFSESSTVLSPKSKYGQSKLENEKFAKKFATENDISIIGLRFFSVYGPLGRPDMAYYSFADAIKQNKKIKLFNKGDMTRDMTYIDDVIGGILETITLINSRQRYKNEIFNLGSDNPISTLKLLNEIEKQLARRAKIDFFDTQNEANYTHADILKAKKILNYSPKTSFKKGIKKFLDWHESYYEK